MKKFFLLFVVFFSLASCSPLSPNTNNDTSKVSMNSGIINAGKHGLPPIPTPIATPMVTSESGSCVKTQVPVKKVIPSTSQYSSQFALMKSIRDVIDYNYLAGIQVIQGDSKAEYVSNNFDYTKSDTIKITIKGKMHSIPGIYNKDDPKNKEFIQCMKDQIQSNKSAYEKNGVWYTGKDDPLWYYCDESRRHFEGFIGFSPDGRYLSYNIVGFEYGREQLIDIISGEIIKNGFFQLGWIQDTRQLLFLGEGVMSSVGDGLFITVKGAFPKEQEILEGKIEEWYMDKEYIYVSEYLDGGDAKTYRKVIDLNTLNSIFTEEVQYETVYEQHEHCARPSSLVTPSN